MKRCIIQTRPFKKEIDSLIAKRKVLQEDFDKLQEFLAEFPLAGDLLVGAGGIRKVRLKGASSGKSSGFRVCYYYYGINECLYLIYLYSKNKLENITAEDKKEFKKIIILIKSK